MTRHASFWLLPLLLVLYTELHALPAGITSSHSKLYRLDYAGDYSSSLQRRIDAAGYRLAGRHRDGYWLAWGDMEAGQLSLSHEQRTIHIQPLRSAERMSRRLRDRRYSAHTTDHQGNLLLIVQFLPAIDEADARALLRSHGGRIISHVHSINSFVVVMPESRMLALAGNSQVLWMEEALPPPAAVNNNTRQIIGVEDLHWFPSNLRGAGVAGLVYDADVIYSHSDLEAPRVTAGELPVQSQGFNRLHATHVSGILGGSGQLGGGQYRGMAPDMNMLSFGFCCTDTSGWLYTDPGDIENDYQAGINAIDIDLVTNSISTNIAANGFNCDWEGDYNTTAQLLDAIATGSLGKPVSIFWAVGNERDSGACGNAYGTVPPPANAKNIITVGASDTADLGASFSSWGPSDDGRIKPDLVAPGVGVTSASGSIEFNTEGYTSLNGTSQATPAVAGVAALMLENHRKHYPQQPDPLPASLRAALIHSAVDLGNPGPDYQYGFGRVDATAAVDIMATASTYLEDKVFSSGDSKEYFVVVQSADTQLKATLAWADPPALPMSMPALVNNLDLELESPGGQIYQAWTLDPANPGEPAVRAADAVNVAELAFVDDPEVGIWTIRIRATQLLQSQAFSLVYTPNSLEKTAFPDVSGFSPAVDANGPDPTFVFIFGENFAPFESYVTVNGIHQPISQVYDENLIVTLLSDGDTFGPIEVYTPNGHAVSASNFGDAATGLNINGVWPMAGQVNELIFVFGSGFTAGSGFARFFVNDDEVFIGQAVDNNLLIFQIPDYVTTGPITVTTSEGSVTTTEPLLVIKPPPAVDIMIPMFVDLLNSVNYIVNLEGDNYYDVSDITFNGVSVETFGVLSPQNIQTVVPPGATTGRVCVTTPGGTGCSSSDFIIIDSPAVIQSFSPSMIDLINGANQSIDISGNNLLGTTDVLFNGMSADSFGVVDNTSVQAVTPTGVQTGSVCVVNAGGQTCSSVDLQVTDSGAP